MELKEYKRRLSRVKRKNLPLKLVVKFKTPEHFTIFNEAVNNIEYRKNKKFSMRIYKELIYKFYDNNEFNNTCNTYLKNSNELTKPNFTKIKKEGDYSVENLKVNFLKKSNIYKKELDTVDQFISINRRMKVSVGTDFLFQFEDYDKIRFLLKSIKANGNPNRVFNFSVKEMKDFIYKFYHDKDFNRLYKMYIKSGNKFIRPSLDHKIPISKGGDNSLNNLHFISFLENNAKNDMTWNDWLKIKKSLHKFMKF